MSSSLTARQALWLDPFRPLAAAEQAQLASGGFAVHVVSTLEELQGRLHQAQFLIVRLGENIELLQELQTLMAAAGYAMPVICRIERRQVELVVAAMQHGALHVVAADEWAPAVWQSILVLPKATEIHNRPAAKPLVPRSVVYVDPVSRHLLALAQRVAQANVTALLEGPTGAGKEVLARVLHESSSRARAPFVALNCAALPEHLIEDMLFGHEKGAFTGAVKEYHGVFEQAQGGTLFLDEIAEMPLHLQAKLLRVLQEREIVRLGGERPISLDVRVVAATNRDLREAIAQREFREDLYFRISTFKLRVPSLQERPGDILPLVARLLLRHAQAGHAFSVTAQAQACLRAYAWPGNVRELENVVLRAVVLCNDHVITPAHLMFDDVPQVRYQAAMVAQVVPGAAGVVPPPPVHEPLGPVFQAGTEAVLPGVSAPDTSSLHDAVKSSEHQLIMAAIDASYSRLEAARKLGISPRTLRYKLAKLKGHGLSLSTAA